MKKFLQSWAINTLAVLVAVYILKGRIHYDNWLSLVMASLLLGILNAFLRPLLVFLALPLVIVTLGLFVFVINALLLYFVSFLLRPYFYVDGFAAAFWGALIIGFISLALNTLTGAGNSRVKIQHRRPPSNSDRGGDGPVIDV